jgi:hypothetical protein
LVNTFKGDAVQVRKGRAARIMIRIRIRIRIWIRIRIRIRIIWLIVSASASAFKRKNFSPSSTFLTIVMLTEKKNLSFYRQYLDS